MFKVVIIHACPGMKQLSETTAFIMMLYRCLFGLNLISSDDPVCSL